ncbi:MAG TPA: DUF4432 family protein [Anaerovoracaceae bacterium]|nr:DUF4432 family protein [Anaerovoracaceae bacterium]
MLSTESQVVLQWKSIAAGDYAMGLEPSNSSVFGRAYQEKNEGVHMLKAFEKEIIDLEISIIEGEGEISDIIRKEKLR